MIVRNRGDVFVMIEQHHHAKISAILFEAIKKNLTATYEKYKHSIHLAIDQHDVGWAPFDSSPIWNDEKSEPYDFITLPNSIKSVLYKYGIDMVELTNDYAALLCSHHYVQFVQKNSNIYSKQFVQAETDRQHYIMERFDSFQKVNFLAHYELLQFFDNLSLFLCLHERNHREEDTHFFFKNGINLPKLYGGGKVQLSWKDNTITLNTPLFSGPVTINLQQKIVTNDVIKEVGILNAWMDAPYETVQLTVV